MTETVTEARTVKVGDFFYASWGYDQTNVNFFKVVGLTASGKSARVQEVRSQVVEDNGPQVYVVPTDEPMTTQAWDFDYETGMRSNERTVVAPVMTKRVQTSTWNGEVKLHWRDYSAMYAWDGRPKYVTGWGYGH